MRACQLLIITDALQNPGQLVQRIVVHGLDFFLNRACIFRCLFRQLRNLGSDHCANQANDGHCCEHRNQHRRYMAEPQPPQQIYQRREYEGKQERSSNRDQHLARKIERGHDDCADLER